MSDNKERKAYLVLKDGRVFRGKPFGALGQSSGEVVFNTAMAGYQEILTDPSYDGQIVTMTYPLIGNVGVNSEDLESRMPSVRGFVVKEESHIPSSWRKEKSLGAYLKENNIVGIKGIDTRALTRHIRLHGTVPGIISSDSKDIEKLRVIASKLSGLDGKDCVRNVTCKQIYDWNGGLWTLNDGFSQNTNEAKYKVIAIDLGVKWNILRHLHNINCSVTVVPADTPGRNILAMDPDGVFLSNGPGDPSAVPYVTNTVKTLIGKKPIFGICLGHQILCLALGAKTYKLKFGHHGGNHPVKDLTSHKVEITSQNHNFAVDPHSLPKHMDITHLNLNDSTVEGVSSKTMPIFSVQYHPEASPGPSDASHMFGRFKSFMEKGAL
ncbi:MAG TPA: glutamine-hydrolyzing carbamoyl-phosphate synthase small subunit [Nitrospinota bacterium]|nr:glutamine-hydrolyzing carbamoyl-phosphate synthase small subunit [Nitrospinota bacterium]|tara:strand:+ start:199514 stop:200653 length:1140 start_codon:yes stop_codon:yes gene_type:complete